MYVLYVYHCVVSRHIGRGEAGPMGLIFRIQVMIKVVGTSHFSCTRTHEAAALYMSCHYSRWENLVALNTSADGWTVGHDGKAMKIGYGLHVKL